MCVVAYIHNILANYKRGKSTKKYWAIIVLLPKAKIGRHSVARTQANEKFSIVLCSVLMHGDHHRRHESPFSVLQIVTRSKFSKVWARACARINSSSNLLLTVFHILFSSKINKLDGFVYVIYLWIVKYFVYCGGVNGSQLLLFLVKRCSSTLFVGCCCCCCCKLCCCSIWLLLSFGERELHSSVVIVSGDWLFWWYIECELGEPGSTFDNGCIDGGWSAIWAAGYPELQIFEILSREKWPNPILIKVTFSKIP